LDSVRKERVRLKTVEAGKIRFYSCGPTVYDRLHIGNLRSAVTADFFVRLWKQWGFEVVYVRNYTDIDDKIIQRAAALNMQPMELASEQLEAAESLFEHVGNWKPTFAPKVTEHLERIIDMIQRILDAGHGYMHEGNVWFDAKSVKKRRLFRQTDGSQQESRLSLMPGQRHAEDFALWKSGKPNEPTWPSPFGPGRPGWHIECSAMATHFLGDRIDVHHGGEDLKFPHHENEVLQAEASGRPTPWVQHWLHNGLITLGEEKMSKSLGNLRYADEVLESWGPDFTRFFLLSVHYRSSLELCDARVEDALNQLERILALDEGLKPQGPPSKLPWLRKGQEQILEAFALDANVPKATGVLLGLIREWNRVQDAMQGQDHALMHNIIRETWAQVLGLEFEGLSGALKQVRRSLRARPTRPTDDVILAEVQKRLQAKRNRQFKEADEIRERLFERGIRLLDRPDGSTEFEDI
jgi:cysteinyl-tRNA synthetase